MNCLFLYKTVKVHDERSFFLGFERQHLDVVSEDLIAILLSSVLVGAGVVVARFFREASLLAATFLLGFIGLELTLLLIS